MPVQTTQAQLGKDTTIAMVRTVRTRTSPFICIACCLLLGCGLSAETVPVSEMDDDLRMQEFIHYLDTYFLEPNTLSRRTMDADKLAFWMGYALNKQTRFIPGSRGRLQQYRELDNLLTETIRRMAENLYEARSAEGSRPATGKDAFVTSILEHYRAGLSGTTDTIIDAAFTLPQELPSLLNQQVSGLSYRINLGQLTGAYIAQRVSDGAERSLTLYEEPRGSGYSLKSPFRNILSWTITDSELLLMSADGTVAARFTWHGPGVMRGSMFDAASGERQQWELRRMNGRPFHVEMPRWRSETAQWRDSLSVDERQGPVSADDTTGGNGRQETAPDNAVPGTEENTREPGVAENGKAIDIPELDLLPGAVRQRIDKLVLAIQQRDVETLDSMLTGSAYNHYTGYLRALLLKPEHTLTATQKAVAELALNAHISISTIQMNAESGTAAVELEIGFAFPPLSFSGNIAHMVYRQGAWKLERLIPSREMLETARLILPN